MNAEVFQEVLAQLLTLEMFLIILIGVVAGIVVGGLPGLSAMMAIALMIPITFGMDATTGLVMLTAIFTASIYGGSISAILIHTPGTPSSAATSLDGYPMTQRGEGAKALGAATISSMVGGLISAIALLFLAPPLSRISIMFSSAEYFLIAIFGLTIIGSLAGKSMLKGLTAGVLGLLLGTIGIDAFTGSPRFTFGVTTLESGMPLIPAMIGLFSISQVMIQAEKRDNNHVKHTMQKVKGKVLPTFKELKMIGVNLIRSSGIGTFVGMLPGAGGDIASWISYNEAKRFSKNKETFGKGNIEGVVAPEAANNAVTGGSLIPTLTLGIPGSATTAILLGGFMIQGLNPGRELFTTHANTTYAIIIGFMAANILMGIIGLLGAKHFVKVANIPFAILAPLIIIFSLVGSYAIRGSIFDVWIMVMFGLIGYLFRKTGFHPAPLILGLILGPIAENGFRQAMTMSGGNMLEYFFSRPISIALMVLIILALFSPILSKKVSSKSN
jgi:putative tricarboxylic transport membrane protein